MAELIKWDGDVLNRKPYGDYLYKLIMYRYKARHTTPGSGALCVALEGDWGAGKTFFMERWAADLTTLQHPVVRFNAWENDLSEDPLVGFMAGLKKELEPLFDQLPVTEIARAKLTSMLKQAPKAVLPVAKVLAKGLTKKLLGTDLDEASGAAAAALETAEDSLKEDAADALDKFFEVTLQSHSNRQQAIRSLRIAIEELVDYLGQQEQFDPPLFVLIDELDRCRPDYAIRLLEGIKHLFNAKGVCFVLATNLQQLAASAQAVYGGAFDGYRYLKRFLALECRIPEPDHDAYAKVLASNSIILQRSGAIYSGLPVETDDSSKTLSASFAIVARAFKLDLRSQQEVFDRAEAAAAGLDDNAPLHALYMFILSALFQKGGGMLERLRDEPIPPQSILDQARATNISIDARRAERLVPFTEVLGRYVDIAHTTNEGLVQMLKTQQLDKYPDTITSDVAQNSDFRRRGKSELFAYATLVLQAGHSVVRRA